MNLPAFAVVIVLFGGAAVSGLSITYQDELRLLGAYLRQLHRLHRLRRQQRRSIPSRAHTPDTHPPTGTYGDFADGFAGDLDDPCVPFRAGSLDDALYRWSADTLISPDVPVSPGAAPLAPPEPMVEVTTGFGAEHLAAELTVNPDRFREDTEEVAKEIWRRHCERQLAETNALFDALTASMEGWELPVTAADYPGQRPVSTLPGIQSPTMRAMATFSPETTIQVITRENEKAMVFSWTTGEYSMQQGPVGQVQIAQVADEWGAGMLPVTKIFVKEKPTTPRAGGVQRHRRRRRRH